MLAKAVPTLAGRKVGVLVTNGFDAALLSGLRTAVKKEKATLVVIAPKVGGAVSSAGKLMEADFALSAAPSIFFDAVAIVAAEEGARKLATEAAAVDWLRDAFGHLKVIGHTAGAAALLKAAGVKPGAGVVAADDDSGVRAFVAAAREGRIWPREPKLRSPG